MDLKLSHAILPSGVPGSLIPALHGMTPNISEPVRKCLARLPARAFSNPLAPQPSVVEVLDFSQSRLGSPEDVLALVQYLLSNTPLAAQEKGTHTMKFNSCGLTDQGLGHILALARCLPGLHSLELFSNQLTDDSCAGLAEFLMAGNPPLRRLKLGLNRISCAGVAVLGQGLAANPHLEALHLGGNPIEDRGVAALARVLQTNRALISLSLRDCQLTTACLPALAFVLTRHPSLADLQLKGSALSGWGIHSLSQALAAQTPVSLKTTGLRTLELQATGLTSNDIHLLARAIAHNTTLTGLNLNDNKLGDSGVELLVSALEQNSRVFTVGLRNNQVGLIGCQALSRLLQTDECPLVGLDLGINQIGDIGGLMLGSALQSNSKLQSLDLRDNRLSAEGSQMLASLFVSNQSIRHLDLSCNFHSDLGAVAWSEVLRRHQSLTRISLADGEITEVGGQALLNALQSNSTLRFFDTGGDRSQPPKGNQLSVGLRRALKSALQKGPPVPTAAPSPPQHPDATHTVPTMPLHNEEPRTPPSVLVGPNSSPGLLSQSQASSPSLSSSSSVGTPYGPNPTTQNRGFSPCAWACPSPSSGFAFTHPFDIASFMLTAEDPGNGELTQHRSSLAALSDTNGFSLFAK